MTSVQMTIRNGDILDHHRRLTALTAAANAFVEQLEERAIKDNFELFNNQISFDFITNLSRVLRKRADHMQNHMERTEKYRREDGEGNRGGHRACLQATQREWERFLEIMTTQGLPPQGLTCDSCGLDKDDRYSISSLCHQCEWDQIEQTPMV